MTYDIISTGSKGNAVLINNSILIDCGVPWKLVQPVAKSLRLVLLTHCHSDHFKPGTVRTLHKERPALRWGCCGWMVEPLVMAGVDKRRIDVYDPENKAFSVYGDAFSLRPEFLIHNVPNCGYHIVANGEKLFYATDTGSLDGIEARNYDLYLIEANHTRAELEARVKAKWEAGEYAYEWNAAQNHLSQEQAEDWIYQNIGPNGKYAFLHQHEEKNKVNTSVQD